VGAAGWISSWHKPVRNGGADFNCRVTRIEANKRPHTHFSLPLDDSENPSKQRERKKKYPFDPFPRTNPDVPNIIMCNIHA